MKLQYLSDLHLEYGNRWSECIIPTARYLILAGDISPIFHKKLPPFYSWCKNNFEVVIHIPGNHEYFGTSIDRGEIELKRLCEANGIIYGQKNITYIEGIKIISCTLWTNSNLNCNDYRYIREFYVGKRNDINRDHIKFIEDNIDEDTVVVTHHSPIISGTQRPEHEDDKNTSLYCNNLVDMVKIPRAWIYGHTHHVSDQRSDTGTIITSNPIGNKKEALPYAKSAILEVFTK